MYKNISNLTICRVLALIKEKVVHPCSLTGTCKKKYCIPPTLNRGSRVTTKHAIEKVRRKFNTSLIVVIFVKLFAQQI